MSSPDAFELHRLTHTSDAGTTVGIVAPSWGANIVGFAFQPKALLWPISFLETVDIASLAAKPTSYGAPVLAPTPGRTGASRPGAFRFDGREYRMAHARHGFLRSLPWSVADRTPSSITCVLEVRPAESLGTFPFELRVEHRVEVGGGRLDARLTFRNIGTRDQPICAGWHPYLQRDPSCRLHIPASSFWELDGSEEPVPTGRLVPVSGTSDFRGGRQLQAGEHWDMTFTELAMEAGLATCRLDSEIRALRTGGEPSRVGVRRLVQSGLANIQLYTAPGRAALAVEPFSSPPNAINLLAGGHAHSGVRRLGPGDETSFAMTLRLAIDTA